MPITYALLSKYSKHREYLNYYMYTDDSKSKHTYGVQLADGPSVTHYDHDFGCVAHNRYCMVGLQVGNIDIDLDTITYDSGFTFVKNMHRKRGCATNMWRTVLENLQTWADLYGLDTICVHTMVINPKSFGLFGKLKGEFPQVHFFIESDTE